MSSLYEVHYDPIFRERYDELSSVLKECAIRKESPMDFYRGLFPEGSFGKNLDTPEKDSEGNYIHDGASFGILGVIPDVNLYKQIKLWLDEKNGLCPPVSPLSYSLSKAEMYHMIKYLIYGSHIADKLDKHSDFYEYNLKRLSGSLTDAEFNEDYTEEYLNNSFSPLAGFGIDAVYDSDGTKKAEKVEYKTSSGTVTCMRKFINYPEKPVLSANMSRSERQRQQLIYQLKCARAEYAADSRYERLDIVFNARCYRNISQIDDKLTVYGRVQSSSMYNQRIDDSLSQLSLAIGQQSTCLAPLDYFGKKRQSSKAGKLYAIVLDIDDLHPDSLRRFFDIDFMGLKPTYIVQSGTGLHFYYFLAVPVRMYPAYQVKVNLLKNMLARIFCNPRSTRSGIWAQKQTWWADFRVVGSKTKVYGRYVEAYATGEVWSFTDLVHKLNIASPNDGLGEVDEWGVYLPSRSGMTREEWLAKQDEFKRIDDEVKELRTQALGLKGSGFITRNRGFYDSWCKRCQTFDALHSRYYRTCILFADAAYCRIPYEEVLDFARGDLFKYFNQPLVACGFPFTEHDVMAASRFYSKATENKSYSLKQIFALTGIRLTPSKRNGRTQEEHCAIMRDTRNFKVAAGECKDTRFGAEDGNTAGRKSAEQTVRDYLQEHPDARKVDVIKGTGLTKPTVYKWYNKIKNENNPNS